MALNRFGAGNREVHMWNEVADMILCNGNAEHKTVCKQFARDRISNGVVSCHQ